MSFIDYNFFPILFFLGWNILTTKQFKPTIYSTTNYKTVPALSNFSLSNLINKKTNSLNLQYEKESNILEFVPEFQFLSENQKLTRLSSASSICFGNQTNDASIESSKRIHYRDAYLAEPNIIVPFGNLLPKGNTSLLKFISTKIPQIRNKRSASVFSTSVKKTDAFIFRDIPLNMEADINNYIVKLAKGFTNREKRSYFTNYNLVNNNWKENFKLNLFDFTYQPKKKRFFSSFFPYNYKIKPISSNLELSLNLAPQFLNIPLNANASKEMSLFENDIFFQGLCSSQNDASFWKKISKQIRSTWFFNKIAYTQANSFFSPNAPQTLPCKAFRPSPVHFNGEGMGMFSLKNQTQDEFVLKKHDFNPESSSTKTKQVMNKNNYDGYNSIFKDSSFLKIRVNLEKLNNINSIQKRRSKIRLLLRVPSQKIYSLNRFQIALCFSKILQLPLFFNDSYHFNVIPKLHGSRFNNIKNELEPQTSVLNTQFLGNTQLKSDQETTYVNNYNRIKKIWYMKTQFFQHVAWNMKHKISDIKYLIHTTHLPLNNMDNFVTKPFKIASYQNKEHFSTNDNRSIKKLKEDLKTISFTNEMKQNNPSINFENTKSVWLNHFLEEPKKSSLLKASKPLSSKFCQNYILRIYGGSWYYENLASPFSIFKTISLTSSYFQFEPIPILNSWFKTFNRVRLPFHSNSCCSRKNQMWLSNGVEPQQKNGIGKEKPFGHCLIKSKQFSIFWLYARQYNLLQNFRYWPYHNKLEYDQTDNYFKDSKDIGSNDINDYKFTCFLADSLGYKLPRENASLFLKTMTPSALSNNYFNTHNNHKKAFSSSLTRLESDIGIYSLAHKLSSVGFRNSNSEIDIYPFKYNDSYRYNFQNMNLSNQRLKSFLGLSNFNNKSRDSSVWIKGQQENTNAEKDFQSLSALGNPWPAYTSIQSEGELQNNYAAKKTDFSNFRKFLDFQNPIFSKIYAPLFQPPGVNLLSFISNSFLQIIPSSIINSPSMAFFRSSRGTKETINFFSPHQIKSIKSEYPHYLKNSKTMDGSYQTVPIINESLQVKPKKPLTMFVPSEEPYQPSKILNGLHHKLYGGDGIHSNPYPWITQNVSERWSGSNYLFANQNDNQKPPFFLSSIFLNKFKNTDAAVLKRFLNTDIPMTSQKELLKNSNSQLYFTEKPSCIKKPSIFFSSFRHLPYFFISETLSKKNVIFPQANLCLLPFVNSSNYQLKEPIKNTYSDLSMSKCYLFPNVLKENEKKQIRKPWKGLLQHKYFSLKPLSTFIKKEAGYQTSLFSNNEIRVSPANNVVLEEQTNTGSMLKNIFKHKFLPANQIISKQWSREPSSENKVKSILKTDLVPIKNTWKIFPPLFQPLTFNFIDLNLPRTWSSELITSVFKSTPLNINVSQFSNVFENTKAQTYLDKSTKEKSPYFLGNLFLRKRQAKKKPLNYLPQTKKWNMTQKNFFGFSMPFYFSDFFRFSAIDSKQLNTVSSVNDFDIRMLNGNNQSGTKSTLFLNDHSNKNTGFYEYKQPWNNSQKLEKNGRSMFNETSKFQNSKIIVYSEKPLLKNRTAHGPPLKNQKESISLPSYLKNITNQNYQNLCPNNLNELYFVFWILFNKTLFIYLSLHYLQKFISFLGTEYIRNLFKIFVTMKFIDGNILSIIKTFQDFNFQLNQQNVIDIKVNKQLKNIKRN